MAARLVRQTVTRWLGPDGKRVAPNTPGAEKVVETARKWYGEGIPGMPPTKRVPLSQDKQTAQAMLSQMVIKAERGQLGLADRDALERSIGEWIGEYGEHQRGAGATANHIAMTAMRLNKVVELAKIQTASELQQPGVRLRIENAIAGMPDNKVGPKTKDYYYRDMRSFLEWLAVGAEVISKNPLLRYRQRGKSARVALANPRRARRPLAPAELGRLLDATRESSTIFRGLNGVSRAALYATAAGTGLRAEELWSLTIAQVDLEAETPCIHLRAEAEKSGRGSILPIPPGVVGMLEAAIKGRPAKDRVWPGNWNDRSAMMLRNDLATVEIPYAIEVNGVPHYADFHSLRHFFTTSIVMAGASVKQAQLLARHSSPTLTIGTYSHATPAELAEVAGRLQLGGNSPQSPLAGMQRSEIEGVLIGVLGSWLQWLQPGLQRS